MRVLYNTLSCTMTLEARFDLKDRLKSRRIFAANEFLIQHSNLLWHWAVESSIAFRQTLLCVSGTLFDW